MLLHDVHQTQHLVQVYKPWPQPDIMIAEDTTYGELPELCRYHKGEGGGRGTMFHAVEVTEANECQPHTGKLNGSHILDLCSLLHTLN